MNYPRRAVFALLFACLLANLSVHAMESDNTNVYDHKLVIVGGGHVGIVTAVLEHLRAKALGQRVNITIFEQNENAQQTTGANVWHSHTIDEMMSVLPDSTVLAHRLTVPFYLPGGIMVVDVPGVNDSACARRFKEQVSLNGDNIDAKNRREQLLLLLGKQGMELWKRFYETADSKWRELLTQNNFNPCCELKEGCADKRFCGYRIDLLYKMNKANENAQGMVKTYNDYGYLQENFKSR